jgi:two-component system, sensor histidine kinase
MNTTDAIAVEQAQHIHRNLPTGVVGGLFVACITASAFWGVADHAYLGIWLAANFLTALGRLASWRAFRASSFSPTLAQRWLRHAMAGSAISGAIWGTGTLFMFPPAEIGFHLIYVFAVMMMGVAAMFSFSVHLPTFMSFFLPSAVPAMLGLVAQNTLLHWEIAAAIAIFIAVALRFVRQFNRVFNNAQKLRFENVGLVAQLTEQMESATAANLAKSRFLAAASHDLRQPMHALNLYLGGLAGLELSVPARATLANASQCAQTMDEMFRALLDISRLDAGAVQAELRVFPIAPLLERIRLEIEPQAGAKGLELRVVPCSASIRADPAFVERILRNLTSNAVRYTRRGRILIGCRRRAGALRIAVHDTGPGIAPAEQSAVFEEFYQGDNPARERSKGMGLGLAIVERLAKLMQAPVRLDSKVGRGSAFSVELPLAADPVERPLAARAAGAGRRFAGSLVIVIDDEEMILNATRELLEQWQCTVVTAVSGRSAMQKLSTSPRAPDAIVCDYRLRDGENGLSIIDALRSEFNEDIPAVLVTGDTGPERLREIHASGMSVLHKPLQERTLRDALGQLLRVAAA